MESVVNNGQIRTLDENFTISYTVSYINMIESEYINFITELYGYY